MLRVQLMLKRKKEIVDKQYSIPHKPSGQREYDGPTDEALPGVASRGSYYTTGELASQPPLAADNGVELLYKVRMGVENVREGLQASLCYRSAIDQRNNLLSG